MFVRKIGITNGKLAFHKGSANLCRSRAASAAQFHSDVHWQKSLCLLLRKYVSGGVAGGVGDSSSERSNSIVQSKSSSATATATSLADPHIWRVRWYRHLLSSLFWFLFIVWSARILLSTCQQSLFSPPMIAFVIMAAIALSQLIADVSPLPLGVRWNRGSCIDLHHVASHQSLCHGRRHCAVVQK